jgi:hypothetical protein
MFPCTQVSEFLSGRWTFADARKFALRLGRDMQQHRQQQQHQQGSQRRWEPGLPGSGATGGYAGAAGKSTGRGIGASSSAMTLGPVTGGFGMSGGGQEYESMVAEMEATQREYALFKTFTEVSEVLGSESHVDRSWAAAHALASRASKQAAASTPLWAAVAPALASRRTRPGYCAHCMLQAGRMTSFLKPLLLLCSSACRSSA